MLKGRLGLQLLTAHWVYMGSCQNYGPFLRTLNIRCRIIIRSQKGTLILTTTHMALGSKVWGLEIWAQSLIAMFGKTVAYGLGFRV